MTMTNEEHAAFFRGFDLAQPPGRKEADALDRASELAPAEVGHLRVAVPKSLAKHFLAVLDTLPEHLAAAAWTGFIRGLVAKAGAAPVYVHDARRA